MKRIENFKKNEIQTKNIFGGAQVETKLGSTKDANGCTTTTTDNYNDANGDGKWNTNENGTICATVVCQ